jgi:hypothetical protein
MAPKGEFGAYPRYDDAQPASRPTPGEPAVPSRASDERNAMAEVAVEVPAPVVPAVRDTLVLLYRATTEALQLSLDAHSQGREPAREVGRHRARLEQLGRMLDRLGWPGEPPASSAWPPGAAGPVELRGPREVVHDALHGALIDAGERLAVACSATWHSEASEASVRELAAQVIALDGLVRELDAGGRGGR